MNRQKPPNVPEEAADTLNRVREAKARTTEISSAGQREPEAGRAGWYPDPDNRHEQRYFDGQAWTERTRTAGPMESLPD